MLLTGAAAIVSREDGRELVLSIPFGAGAALILDEIGHLVERDDPYWGHERLVLAQAASSAAVAAGLCVRFMALARET